MNWHPARLFLLLWIASLPLMRNWAKMLKRNFKPPTLTKIPMRTGKRKSGTQQITAQLMTPFMLSCILGCATSCVQTTIMTFSCSMRMVRTSTRSLKSATSPLNWQAASGKIPVLVFLFARSLRQVRMPNLNWLTLNPMPHLLICLQASSPCRSKAGMVSLRVSLQSNCRSTSWMPPCGLSQPMARRARTF